jgi:hypothetical protein
VLRIKSVLSSTGGLLSLVLAFTSLGFNQPAWSAEVYAVSGTFRSGNGTRPIEESVLYRIDTDTGLASPIGTGTGVNQITGLAFDPTDGALYGYQNFPGGGIPVQGALHRIDLTTGASVPIGGDTLSAVTDITFDASGQLYGWLNVTSRTDLSSEVADSSIHFSDKLVTIDKTNGDIALVNPDADAFIDLPSAQTGISFSPDGRLWVKAGTVFAGDPLQDIPATIYQLDPATGLTIDSVVSSPGPISTLQTISDTTALTIVRGEIADSAGGPATQVTALSQIDLVTGDQSVAANAIFDPVQQEFLLITAIAAPVAIPEPAAVLFTGGLLMTMIWRRRRGPTSSPSESADAV